MMMNASTAKSVPSFPPSPRVRVRVRVRVSTSIISATSFPPPPRVRFSTLTLSAHRNHLGRYFHLPRGDLLSHRVQSVKSAKQNPAKNELRKLAAEAARISWLGSIFCAGLGYVFSFTYPVVLVPIVGFIIRMGYLIFKYFFSDKIESCTGYIESINQRLTNLEKSIRILREASASRTSLISDVDSEVQTCHHFLDQDP